MGSGIVETNDDYEEEDYEGVNIDSNDSIAREKADLGNSDDRNMTEKQDSDGQMGAIAKLVQKRQEMSNEDDSNYTASAGRQSGIGAEDDIAVIVDDDDVGDEGDQISADYCNDDFMESGSRNMSGAGQFDNQNAILQKNELSDDDYEDDPVDDEDDYEREFDAR